MPWKQNPDTGESYWVEDGIPGAGTESGTSPTNPTTPVTAPAATDPATAGVSTIGTNVMGGVGQAAAGITNAYAKQDRDTAALADPNSPTWKGPGYKLFTDSDGRPAVRLSDDPNDQIAQSNWEKDRAAQAANPDIMGQTQQTLNGLEQGTQLAYTPPAAFRGTMPATNAAPRTARAIAAPRNYVNAAGIDTRGVNLGPGAPAPTDTRTAPTVDRTKIDPLLQGLNTYANDIYALSKDNTGLSAAEAQLQKATELANIQAGIETDKSQRAALGQARSARNRGDRAFLEQSAIGQAGFIGQEAARTKALTDATARGDLATLRANEEDADRRFRLDALSKASELGLNTAALEADISKADLGSATNLLNNQFQQLGIDKQLDQNQAQMVLNFTRDMAAIQFQYDQLSTTDKQEAAKLLMQKYNIDEDTRVALEKIKTDNDFDWNGLLSQVIGGAASGATAAIAHGSDERLKKAIAPVDPAELEELLDTVKAETWEYKDDDRFGHGTRGKRLGPMAQDLQKSTLGRSMVLEDPGGFLAVDTGRAGLAALSGLALVHDRLQALEKAVSK